MKRKISIVYKTGRKKIILLLLIALIIALLKTTPTITYAQGLIQFVAEVGVQPYYKIHTQGNILYINTNMTLYVNNKQITYYR